MSADVIQTVIYLIPIATLIWKAAGMASEIKTLRKDVDRLTVQVHDEKGATDSSIATIMAMLNEIKIAVARIETKVEGR